MSTSKKAVVDLGTNTFHLLVVEMSDDGTWTEFMRERVFVNLAEEGIGKIGADAWKRAVDTIRHFGKIIRAENVCRVKAVGTAALRTAANANALVEEIRKVCCVDVEVITGDEEARYISQGVMQAAPKLPGDVMIMDIGGGSVEFIHLLDGEIANTASFPIGVAVLYNRFHKSDPIATDDMNRIDKFLEPYFDVLRGWLKGSGCHLIGASGTFEVLDAALHKELEQRPYTTYEIDQFLEISRAVTAMSLSERLEHPDIPRARARYIVVALYLIKSVINELPIDSCGISRYAMKEGIVASL